MRSVLNSSLSLRKRTPRLRVGFTLIELMVVIVIIAILIGLLVPAVMGVRKTARDVEVRTDISKLEDAIAKFKVTYGTEPPSQLTLYAAPTAWELTAVSRRHKGLIKQLWPQFSFANCGGLSNGTNFPAPWPASRGRPAPGSAAPWPPTAGCAPSPPRSRVACSTSCWRISP